MSTVQKSIDVNVPVSTAYNQWTQFEEFPAEDPQLLTVFTLDSGFAEQVSIERDPVHSDHHLVDVTLKRQKLEGLEVDVQIAEDAPAVFQGI